MSNIDRTIEIKVWEDMNRKYLIDRNELETEEEKEYINDCFSLYEKEGFSKKFWSQGGDFSEYIEKPFEVVERVDTEDADLECLPMWMIKFEDGKQIAAYPDEIIPREMKDNGCKLEGIV